MSASGSSAGDRRGGGGAGGGQPPPSPRSPSPGLATVLVAWLARGDRRFPQWLPAIGLALGAALVATWLGRLVVLDPTSGWLRITTTAAALLNPIVYVGFAATLRRPGRERVIHAARPLDMAVNH